MKNKEKDKEKQPEKEVGSLKQELENSLKNADDLKSTLQYVQAEFENYKKRQDRDMQERVRLSSADIIMKLFPILDDFESSLKNLKSTSDNDELIKGFQIIYNNLLTVLKKEGLEEVNPENEKFDPYMHEALMQEKSDKEPMTVLAVLQKGYKLNGRILRHAKVKIAK
ncbi:MAG: nucleotide exchange factor GrpE [Candidatus Woesearchaeota archaeon]